MGEGQWGKVFLAVDPHLTREVAIKVLHTNISLNPSAQTRFQAEATRLANLASNHIVKVHDYASSGGQQFLVMEVIKGPTLQDVLKSFGTRPFSFLQSVVTVNQIAQGLKEAKRNSLIHRDLKPGNIMLSPQGVLKITDFGISHMGGEGITTPGQLIGTPYYMAPEQTLGEEVTFASDLFALGIIFYQCLTQTMPFTGSDIRQIMARIREHHYQPVTDFHPHIDDDIVEVVDTLLTKNPEERKSPEWVYERTLAYMSRNNIFDVEPIGREIFEKWEEKLSETLKEQTTVPLSKDSSLPVPPSSSNAFIQENSSIIPQGPASGSQSHPQTANPSQSGPQPAGFESQLAPKSNNKLIMAVLILLLLGGLGAGYIFLFKNSDSDKITLQSLQLDNTLYELNVGEQLPIKISAAPENASKKVIWDVQNPEVIIIRNNTIKAKQAGRSSIRAISEDNPKIKARATVIVKASAINNISVSRTSVKVKSGNSRRIIASFTPVSAINDIQWESKNPRIATVQNGKIYGVMPGKTTISAYSRSNPQIRANTNVTVTGKVASTGPRPLPVKKVTVNIKTIPPFAVVYVNGANWGKTPLTKRNVASGRYRVKLDHPKLPAVDTTLSIKPGKSDFQIRLIRR